MKINKELRSITQAITVILVAMTFLMLGSWLQANSPDPRPAAFFAVFTLKLLVATIAFAGIGFLTEEE